MTRLAISHRTAYRYKKPVAFGDHRLMMRPRESYDQHVLSYQLEVTPGASLRHVHDVFGNCVSIASFKSRADELIFDSRVVLERRPAPMTSESEEAIHPSALSLPFAYDVTDMPDLLRSVERGFADPDRAVEDWVRRFLRWNGPTLVLPLLIEMTRAIHAEFTYSRRLEAGAQTPVQTLALRTGACRDFAILMMEAARSLGLAAHFVSGYIYVPPTAGRSGPQRLGGGHTHAWVEVYLPSCGWVEFDPTNGLVGNRDLVRVAVVRDPRQATPLWGSFDGEADDFVSMDVTVDLTLEPDRDLKVA